MALERVRAKCVLCRGIDYLKTIHYDSYPLHGDPARPVNILVCHSCAKSWNGHGGLFTGSSAKADRIRKNLMSITRRPWEWSAHHSVSNGEFVLSGKFHVGEGTVYPQKKPALKKREGIF